MKRIFIIFIIILLIFQSGLASALETGIMALYPIADATVISNKPENNYGLRDTLKVSHIRGSDGEIVAYALLEFDLSGIPPMISAQLSLYCYYLSDSRMVRVYFFYENRWSEGEMTWSKLPSNLETQGTSLNITRHAAWYSVNITDEVGITYGSPDKSLTIVLVAESAEKDVLLGFYSKDQTFAWLDGYRPKLVLSYQKIETEISLNVSPKGILLGENITLFGTINDNIIVDGKGYYPGIEISYVTPDGSITTKWVESDSAGRFEDVFKPEMTGQWTVVASWPGIEFYSSARKEVFFNASEPDSESQPTIPVTTIVIITETAIIGIIVVYLLQRKRFVTKINVRV